MKHNKITFNTVDKATRMTGTTTCLVYPQKAIYRFSTQGLGEITFKKMKDQGLKVLFERGMIVQFFAGKTIDEIADILIDDINKGAENTKGTKAEILIENLNRENIE